MNRKYSAFLGTGSTSSDRFCPAYKDQPLTIEEKFDQMKSVNLLSAVDLYMDDDMIRNIAAIKKHSERTQLPIISVAVDVTGKKIYKKGAFSAIDPGIRRQAIADAKACVDYARELGATIVSMWPGQDGYDYLFQSDYIKERRLFTDGLAELCDYAGDLQVSIEYKAKEPRTHSLVGSVGTVLLMVKDVGAENLGVAMDYGHAVLGYESPAEAVALCTAISSSRSTSTTTIACGTMT